MRRWVVFVVVALVAGLACDFAVGTIIVASRVLNGHPSPSFKGDRIDHLLMGSNSRLYALGELDSPNFPGMSTAQTTNGGAGMLFVSRIDPDTLLLDWTAPVGYASTTLDPDPKNRLQGFALGPDNVAYVAAYETSVRFPSLGGSYVGAGNKAIFRVDGSGSVSRHPAVLDPAIQTIRALAADRLGNLYLTGRALASLATTSGAAVGSSRVAGHPDAPYLVKIAPNGSTIFATFLTVPRSRPGRLEGSVVREPYIDEFSTGYAIAVAPDGSILIAGQSAPDDFPATAGAADTLDFRYRDAFVARLNAAGTAVLSVARIGGADEDRATDVALLPDGSALIVGKSLQSPTWHGPLGGFQSHVFHDYQVVTPLGVIPAEIGFLTRVAVDGRVIGATSMIGASAGNLHSLLEVFEPMPLRIALDNSGHAYITGTANGWSTLPTLMPAVEDRTLDVGREPSLRPFLLKVAVADFTLRLGSRFGVRKGDSHGMGVAVDALGNAYVAGFGDGTGFPVVRISPRGRQIDAPFYSYITKINSEPGELTTEAKPSLTRVGTPVQVTVRIPDQKSTGFVDLHDNGTLAATIPLKAGTATTSLQLPLGIHRIASTVRGAGMWQGTRSMTFVVVEQAVAAQ